jgi:hypothetical protein
MQHKWAGKVICTLASSNRPFIYDVNTKTRTNIVDEEIFQATRLKNGNFMLIVIGNEARIMEIDTNGKLVRQKYQKDVFTLVERPDETIVAALSGDFLVLKRENDKLVVVEKKVHMSNPVMMHKLHDGTFIATNYQQFVHVDKNLKETVLMYQLTDNVAEVTPGKIVYEDDDENLSTFDMKTRKVQTICKGHEFISVFASDGVIIADISNKKDKTDALLLIDETGKKTIVKDMACNHGKYDLVGKNVIGFGYKNRICTLNIRTLQRTEHEVQGINASEKVIVRGFVLVPSETEETKQEPIEQVSTKKKVCNSCGASDKKLSVCSRCKSVWYCDGTCQKNDWLKHKQECKLLKFTFILRYTRTMLVSLLHHLYSNNS